MASSLYLSSYGIVKETGYFKFSFDIPINCTYTVIHNAGESNYTIVISIAPSEKGPSPIFSTESISVECDASGEVCVEFELPSSGLGLAKRPKLTVNDLIP